MKYILIKPIKSRLILTRLINLTEINYIYIEKIIIMNILYEILFISSNINSG